MSRPIQSKGKPTAGSFNAVLALVLAYGIVSNGRALAKVFDDGPQSLSQVSSIGESLRNSGSRPLHILYVHGIGAIGAGGSQAFQKSICAFLKDCTAPASPAERDYADTGEFAAGAEPPAFSYMGRPVWRSKDEWSASDPFVDHYVLTRSDGGPIVVDEINWWPLALPLKCRAIVAGEARMAGPNKQLLDYCSQSIEADPASPGRFRSYTWVDTDRAKRLETAEPRGALINRWFKTSIMDWGFSDAMIAVGSMHGVFREGMRQLFLKSVKFSAGGKAEDWEQQWKDPHGVDREFIVVSHSLGSYLVFSTLNLGQRDVEPLDMPAPTGSGAAAEDAAAQYILERTSLVYFFANQVPLLELANMRAPEATGLAPGEAPSPEAMSGAVNALMMKWKVLRDSFAKRRSGEAEAKAKPAQVIAWSDPSDLLSWRLPAMDGLVVTNLYVRKTRWHWIIANPATAHTNYATNKQVLRIMFGPKVRADKGKGEP